MFIRRKKKEDSHYSWGDHGEHEQKSHSMWSREIKKILKKVGLC